MYKTNYLCLMMLVVIICGCQQPPQERRYTEITEKIPAKAASLGQEQLPAGHPPIDMAASGAMNTPVGTVNDEFKGRVNWILPNGWQEQPAQAMRLATFKLAGDLDAFDCSIVALPGGAGGLEANLMRWLGQVGLTLEPADLTEFINASEGGVYDFTHLQTPIPESKKSMIVAMLDIGGSTLFVKMSGTYASVNEHKSSFMELVKSIKSK